jgi:heme-degrading monooxygenase HmoA
MFVVLFEVQPKPEQWERYLQLAALLRPELIEIRGFIDNERYASERADGRLLSLSSWEDEKALIRWRTHARHHEVQRRGRCEVFKDYHLRVGEVLSDSDHGDVPWSRLDVTEVGSAPAVTVSEAPQGEDLSFPESSPDMLDAESYSGITTTGKRLLLSCWCSDAAASEWIERQSGSARHRHIRVIRDYGMHGRQEAPQYFADTQDVAPVARVGL